MHEQPHICQILLLSKAAGHEQKHAGKTCAHAFLRNIGMSIVFESIPIVILQHGALNYIKFPYIVVMGPSI